MTEPNDKPSAFRTWARTGRWPVDEPIETKFNPNHDERGRFTFASGGGGYRDYAGTQTAGILERVVIGTVTASHPEIVRNTRSLVKRITANQLSEAELDALTKHVFNNIKLDDAKKLGNVSASLPTSLSRDQMSVVEKLIDEMPNDDLGRKTRRLFEQAKEAGIIRVKP